jgi:hypothetical protein
MLDNPFHALAQVVPSPFVETALSTYQTLPPVDTGTVGVAVGGIIVLTAVAVAVAVGGILVVILVGITVFIGVAVAVGGIFVEVGLIVATFVGSVVADGPTVGTMTLPPVVITS